MTGWLVKSRVGMSATLFLPLKLVSYKTKKNPWWSPALSVLRRNTRNKSSLMDGSGMTFLTKQSSTLLSGAQLQEGPQVWMALHRPCCRRARMYWHQIFSNCAWNVWGLVSFPADGERLELSLYQRWGRPTCRVPRHIDQSP